METIYHLAEGVAPRFLRFSLGIVLFWIGALKFAHPGPVVDLLNASLSFLAFNAFVYLLGMAEVVSAILLFAGIGLRYVGLVVVGLFLGTITIFLVAPAVVYGDAGFPNLTLAGEFLLKDLVLMAAALTLVASDSARVSMRPA